MAVSSFLPLAHLLLFRMEFHQYLIVGLLHNRVGNIDPCAGLQTVTAPASEKTWCILGTTKPLFTLINACFGL